MRSTDFKKSFEPIEKSEALFNKYFERKKDFRYISLPSSSPANADINFESICKVWQQIIL